MTDPVNSRRVSYTLAARVAPALLSAAPALALAMIVLPMLPGVQKLWSILGLGLTTYAGLVARKVGARVQDDLWATWGGAPTARRLRYRESGNSTEIDRRHRDFERALGDTVQLPTAAEEAADPAMADDEYQQAVRRFIGTVRHDRAFPLLHAENRNYGFARNLYGLRPMGRVCAWSVLAISVVAGLLIGVADQWTAASQLVFPGAASVIALILWRQVDPDFVRPSADAYADRLIEAAQRIARAR